MAIIWFSEYLLIGISQHVFFISLKMLRFLILFGKSCDILDTTEFWNKTDLGLKTNSALDWHVSLAKTGQCLACLRVSHMEMIMLPATSPRRFIEGCM